MRVRGARVCVAFVAGLQVLVSRFDSSGDGAVSYDEFVRRLVEVNSKGRYHPMDWAVLDATAGTGLSNRVDEAELALLRRISRGVGVHGDKIRVRTVVDVVVLVSRSSDRCCWHTGRVQSHCSPGVVST